MESNFILSIVDVDKLTVLARVETEQEVERFIRYYSKYYTSKMVVYDTLLNVVYSSEEFLNLRT